MPSMSRSFIRRIINCSSLLLFLPLFFLSFAPFGQSSPSIDQYLFGLSVRISGDGDGGDAEDFIGTPSPLLPRRTTLMNASLPRAGRVEALQSISHSRSWEVPVTVVSSLKSCTDNLKWRECKGPYLNDVYTIFGILDPLPPLSTFWQDP